MKKWFKWVGIGVAVLVLLPVLAVAITWITLPRVDEALPRSEAPADTTGAVRTGMQDWRIASQQGDELDRIEVTFEAGDHGVARGGMLKISLGHLLPTEQQLYTPFSLTAPSVAFFGINLLQDVHVECSNADVTLKVIEPSPKSGLMQMFGYIKYKRGKRGDETTDSFLRQIDNEFAIRVEVARGELQPGDTIDVVIGHQDGIAPPTREASLQVVVRLDGDGDGVFGIVPDPPSFDVYSADTAEVVLVAPSRLQPCARSTLTLRTQDDYFLPNLTRFEQGHVALEPIPGLEFPTDIELKGDLESWDASVWSLPITERSCLWDLEAVVERPPGFTPPEPLAPGTVVRIRGTATIDGEEFAVLSNPIEIVGEGEPGLYFGDTHTHSILSYDADRPPEYVYWRQQHQERHDFAMLTDHDCIGFVPFAPRDHVQGRSDDEWAYIQTLADEHYEPGRFVTFHAYEWTSYYYGHRNIYYAPDATERPLLHHNRPSDEEPLDQRTPAELFGDLASASEYIAIPHSPAWPTQGVQYAWGPGQDEVPQQKLVELYSTHGTSEFFDNEYAVDKGHPEAPTDSDLVKELMSYNIQQAPADSGNFVQDALADGRRFGFVGSSDMHYLSHIDQAYKYGLAGVYADELTREGIWDGLTTRHTYAVTGVRILVDFTAGGQPMGRVVPPPADGQLELAARVAGTGPLDFVEIVKFDGAAYQVVHREEYGEELDAALEFTDEPATGGQFYYLRVRQDDGNRAWASPIWLDAAAPSPADASADGDGGVVSPVAQRRDPFEPEALPDGAPLHGSPEARKARLEAGCREAGGRWGATTDCDAPDCFSRERELACYGTLTAGCLCPEGQCLDETTGRCRAVRGS